MRTDPDKPKVGGLSPEEDAELRRINELMPYVDRDSPIIERFHELRERDRRGEVRELAEDDVAHVIPPQREQESPG